MGTKIVITKQALKYIEKMSKENKEFLKIIVQGATVIKVLEMAVKASKIKKEGV